MIFIATFIDSIPKNVFLYKQTFDFILLLLALHRSGNVSHTLLILNMASRKKSAKTYKKSENARNENGGKNGTENKQVCSILSFVLNLGSHDIFR